jgi:LPXTG-motif cell wall-anchored protein
MVQLVHTQYKFSAHTRRIHTTTAESKQLVTALALLFSADMHHDVSAGSPLKSDAYTLHPRGEQMAKIRIVSRRQAICWWTAAIGAGTLALFGPTATAYAVDQSGQTTAAPVATASSSDSAVAAGIATQTSSAVSATTSSATAASSTTASTSTPSPTAVCPAQVQIVLTSISVSGDTVLVSFTHTGVECPDATSSVLHVHENLVRTAHAGSDPVQSNRDFAVTPSFGNSVTVPLLEAVEGKCFVQVDVHANGAAHGQFFPTATCPSTTPSTSVSPSQSVSASQSTSPSQSIEPSQAVNPPPLGSTTPATTPSQAVAIRSEAPTLPLTGARSQNLLVLAGLLLGIGGLLLVASRLHPTGRRGQYSIASSGTVRRH